MLKLIRSWYHTIHGRWPAGTVERLPKVGEQGRTSIPGVYIVGDLSGIPLLKMSLETGVQAVRDALESIGSREGEVDFCIIGGGVAGVAAAVEVEKQGRSYTLLENNRLFSTIANFPKGKPIYTYPTDMNPAGDLQVSAEVKEELLAELEQQAKGFDITARSAKASHVSREGKGLLVHLDNGEPIRAKNVIIAIGRSGNYRTMDVPGEDLDKVSNRLHDPADFHGKKVLVVGGGDSACETAISIAEGNDGDQALVTLSYRRDDLSRPKPENVKRIQDLAEAGKIDLQLGTAPTEITADKVTLKARSGTEFTIENDQVFAMIGREAPLDFFRRSGLPIHGEYGWGMRSWLIGFVIFAILIYGMKAFGWFGGTPIDPVNWLPKPGDSKSFIGSMLIQAQAPGFWITLLYCSAVVGFGIARIRRRRTPYVTVQTTTLMTIQCIPLFILPELLLPWLGRNDWIPAAIENALFPNESWWRAYGFILAWPLFIWNVFTESPLWWWLGISIVQTFVLIPLLIRRWGKGAYCGWICSCGALAETMGDTHREKMPHGPVANRFNMVGQVAMVLAFVILAAFVIRWITSPAERGHVQYSQGITMLAERSEEVSVSAEHWDANQDVIKLTNTGSAVLKPTLEIDGPAHARLATWSDVPELAPGASTTVYLKLTDHATATDAATEQVAWMLKSGDMVLATGQLDLASEERVIAASGPFVGLSALLRDSVWKPVIDYALAGALGVGLYFWLSGRVWCRFACPLAALMHIYALFSRFRILVSPKKCISCNLCTSVCHQGIDIMNFANKGDNMRDPECVRCSACVQTCPTGVLQFGRVDGEERVVAVDSLAASRVLMREQQGES